MAAKLTGQRTARLTSTMVLATMVLATMVLATACTSALQRIDRDLAPAIESLAGLEPINVDVAAVDHRGRRAVRVTRAANATTRAYGESMVLLPGRAFREGTINLDVAGAPGPKAHPDDRGFIGIAFHVQAGEARYKVFYLRPTNGRADDQLRRNHATQYVAEPEWPWQRLRKEEPGRYESYADLEAGAWTAVRIVVRGSRAELYVNEATQPALVVTDMKVTDPSGGLALWIGSGTEGYFTNLRVTRADDAAAAQP